MERVNITRGWVLFLIGAFISLSLGISRYYFLSNSKIQSRIEQELTNQAFRPENYRFNNARIAFGYSIALEFDSISILPTRCGQLEGHLKNVSLPMSWLSLFRGKVFFSELGVKSAELIRKKCPVVTKSESLSGQKGMQEHVDQVQNDLGKSFEEASAAAAQAQLHQVDPKMQISKGLLEFKNYFKSAFYVDFLKVKKYFNLLNIENLNYFKNSNHLFSLKKLVLNLEDTQILGNWDLVLSQEIIKGQPLKEIRTSFNIDFDRKNIKLNTTTLYKEGRIYADFTYDIENLILNTKSRLKYLPGYYIFIWLSDLGILSFDVEPQWIWFNCQLSSDVDFDEPRSSFIKFKACDLMGDLVDVKLPELTIYPWKKKQFQPFDIHFQKVELEKLLKGLGHGGPKGLLTSYGTLSGVMTVETPRKFTFNGKLKDLGLYFVRKGIRGKQKIPSQTVKLTYEKDRFSGLIRDSVLDKGVLEGEMSFNFNTSFTEGVVQLGFDKVGFHPAIQQILVEGEMAPLSVFGKGMFNDGQMIGWEGAIGTSYIKGPKYEASKIRIKALYADKNLETWWKVDRLNFYNGNLYYSALEPMFLSKVKVGEPLVFEDMEAKVTYIGRRGQWQRFKAAALNGEVLLASSGSWTKDFKLRGSLHLDNIPLKLLKWDISGEVDNPSIAPSPQLLLELRDKDPEMTVPAGLSMDEQLELVKKYLIKLSKGNFGETKVVPKEE